MDPTKQIASIAKILGVDANDEAAVRAAFENLFTPAEEESLRVRTTLSARELQLCRANGVAPSNYVKVRNAIRARSRRG